MIIFLYGEDTYRSNQKLLEIKDKFLKEVDTTSMNLIVLDGATLKFEEFNKQVKASPFLARKRMIIIKNLISSNKSKEIQKEIAKLLEEEIKNKADDNIIVFWEEADHSKSKSKNALWDRLVKEKFAQEFKPLTPSQLNAWVGQEIQTRGAQIEKNAIPLLAAIVGNDLWHQSNEIAKLINYCQGKTITSSDIESLVKAKFDDNIFNFIDALSANNKKLSLKLLADQFQSGADEIYLLSMFIRQFRILLLTKDLLQTQGRLTSDQLSQKLKIHPFVAKKSLGQAQNFSLAQLKKIYSLLLDLDLKLKTTSGKAKIYFDLLIAQI